MPNLRAIEIMNWDCTHLHFLPAAAALAAASAILTKWKWTKSSHSPSPHHHILTTMKSRVFFWFHYNVVSPCPCPWQINLQLFWAFNKYAGHQHRIALQYLWHSSHMRMFQDRCKIFLCVWVPHIHRLTSYSCNHPIILTTLKPTSGSGVWKFIYSLGLIWLRYHKIGIQRFVRYLSLLKTRPIKHTWHIMVLGCLVRSFAGQCLSTAASCCCCSGSGRGSRLEASPPQSWTAGASAPREACM